MGNEDGLKEAIVQMLGGAHIRLDTGTFQNDMTTIKRKDDVLTLLIHLGYLAYDADAKRVFIPNEEVRQEFVRAVTTGRHQEIAKLIRNSDLLLEQSGSSLPILLIELKWNKSEDGAIRQIKKKHYPQVFQEYSGDVLLIGICYDAKNKKHTCNIEKWDRTS